MEKIKNYLQYIGIAAAIIGIFVGIRFLALEFAAVRWTLVILICMAIKDKVFIPNFITLSFIVQLPLYYIVTGFLFGYSTINGLISVHWVGLLITIAVMLGICIYMDVYIHKKLM